MTTCVAVICDNARAIALAADRMVGGSVIESPIGQKIFTLHKNWRVLISGDDADTAFPVIERATNVLRRSRLPSTADVATVLSNAYKQERLDEAVTRYITPRGLTLRQFIDQGKRLLNKVDFQFFGDQLYKFDFEIDLLVAGFDQHQKARLFSLSSRGITRRREGFFAVGSGADVADFIMNVRQVTPKLSVREGVYYALEAKYYGELAPGVSEATDLYLFRFGKSDIEISEDTIDDILVNKIATKVEPQDLRPTHINLLNSLKELKGFPPITNPQKKKSSQTSKAKKA